MMLHLMVIRIMQGAESLLGSENQVAAASCGALANNVVSLRKIPRWSTTVKKLWDAESLGAEWNVAITVSPKAGDSRFLLSRGGSQVIFAKNPATPHSPGTWGCNFLPWMWLYMLDAVVY